MRRIPAQSVQPTRISATGPNTACRRAGRPTITALVQVRRLLARDPRCAAASSAQRSCRDQAATTGEKPAPSAAPLPGPGGAPFALRPPRRPGFGQPALEADAARRAPNTTAAASRSPQNPRLGWRRPVHRRGADLPIRGAGAAAPTLPGLPAAGTSCHRALGCRSQAHQRDSRRAARLSSRPPRIIRPTSPVVPIKPLNMGDPPPPARRAEKDEHHAKLNRITGASRAAAPACRLAGRSSAHRKPSTATRPAAPPPRPTSRAPRAAPPLAASSRRRTESPEDHSALKRCTSTPAGCFHRPAPHRPALRPGRPAPGRAGAAARSRQPSPAQRLHQFPPFALGQAAALGRPPPRRPACVARRPASGRRASPRPAGSRGRPRQASGTQASTVPSIASA